MKKFLIGAAATAAMLAPTVASADTNAVVGLAYSSSEVDSADWDQYGINGAFSHAFDGGTFIQFEAASERVDFGGCCFSTGYAAAHYGVRNDSYALAGFVSFDELFIYSGIGYGVEGQWYMPNMVFNGSLAATDFGDLDASTTSASVDGSYFFTPNFSVTGAVTFADDELYGDDLTIWGIGGEYRFANNPVSIELGYRQAEVFDDDVTAWTIGFNIDLGADSLYDRATSGPSLSGASYSHQAIGIVPLP
jgi:hypothetical protein